MPYNFAAAELSHKDFFEGNAVLFRKWSLCVFESPGDLETTYAVLFMLIRKPVVGFVLVIR